MNEITTMFISAANLLRRRFQNINESNKELNGLNNVSKIFSSNTPMCLTIALDTNPTRINGKFIRAVDSLEEFHKEEVKINEDERRIKKLTSELELLC